MADLLAKFVRKKDLTVHEEPRVQMHQSFLKPDLVVQTPRMAVVLDVTVVGDDGLAAGHHGKIDKYNLPQFNDALHSEVLARGASFPVKHALSRPAPPNK